MHTVQMHAVLVRLDQVQHSRSVALLQNMFVSWSVPARINKRVEVAGVQSRIKVKRLPLGLDHINLITSVQKKA
jgi:hypothetical protein